MLTGENGILTKSKDSEIETRGASVQEARDLWKTNQEADKHTEDKTAQTLEELLNDLVNQDLLTENEKDQIIGNDEKGIEAKGEITIGSRTIQFMNNGKIHFSIDEEEYEVLEGTTWNDFFSENFPNDWGGWMYLIDSGIVVYFVHEEGYTIEVVYLVDLEDIAVKKDNLIEARSIS